MNEQQARAIQDFCASLAERYDRGAQWLPSKHHGWRRGLCHELTVALEGTLHICSVGYVVGRTLLDYDKYTSGLGDGGVFTQERRDFLQRIIDLPPADLAAACSDTIARGATL